MSELNSMGLKSDQAEFKKALTELNTSEAMGSSYEVGYRDRD